MRGCKFFLLYFLRLGSRFSSFGFIYFWMQRPGLEGPCLVFEVRHRTAGVKFCFPEMAMATATQVCMYRIGTSGHTMTRIYLILSRKYESIFHLKYRTCTIIIWSFNPFLWKLFINHHSIKIYSHLLLEFKSGL